MRQIRSFTILALVGGSGLALAQSTFVDLGAGRQASGVSADGKVVGGTDPSQYFVWTPSSGITLIGGTAAGNGVGGQARVSNGGNRVCGTYLNPASGLHEIAYYDRSTATWTPLGGIGGSSGTEKSSGWGISGDGRAVIGLGWVNAGSAHAIRWMQGGILADLGSTVANRSTRANGTNASGSAIVGWQDATSGFRQGAVWFDGVQTIITTAGGSPVSEAQDISDVGNWVVGNGGSSTSNQAWRWSPTTGLQNLGALNPTWTGYATGISEDGKTIIGFERAFGQSALFGVGFIWRQGVGMTDLKTYLISKGVPVPAAWTLALPLGISADGRTIVGQGRNGNVASGFVAHIDDCAGSTAAYGAGLAGSGNYVPYMAVNGCPVVGTAFTLDITSVRGAASGMMFVGLTQTSVPLLGGQFLVGSLVLSLPIAVGGTPGANAAGGLSLPVTLTDPALIGLTITLQSAFFDPGAVLGVSLTNGVTLTIG